MLQSLWLPILLSAVALILASFLSWMILQLHRDDWVRIPGNGEEALLKTLGELNLEPGGYMFPAPEKPADMQSEEYQKKWRAGPRGVMTIFGSVNMGQNLALTFVTFVIVSILLAYLAGLGLPAGAPFLDVFRFVFTATLLAFLTGIVQHSIWFKNRIVGTVIESVAYACITGMLFAVFWPAA